MKKTRFLKKKMTPAEKNLIRRYLLWCYKTTKEGLDRIDRKFTQLAVDYRLLETLLKKRAPSGKMEAFRKYIAQKEKEAGKLKYEDNAKGRLTADYQYLQCRLEAVEESIVFFLGKQELGTVESLYEKEMTRRILEAREHT